MEYIYLHDTRDEHIEDVLLKKHERDQLNILLMKMVKMMPCEQHQVDKIDLPNITLTCMLLERKVVDIIKAAISGGEKIDIQAIFSDPQFKRGISDTIDEILRQLLNSDSKDMEEFTAKWTAFDKATRLIIRELHELNFMNESGKLMENQLQEICNGLNSRHKDNKRKEYLFSHRDEINFEKVIKKYFQSMTNKIELLRSVVRKCDKLDQYLKTWKVETN